MKPFRIAGLTGGLLALLLMIAADGFAQDAPRRDRENGGAAGQSRAGGIPRAHVERQEGAHQEGTEEGRPRLVDEAADDPMPRILPPERPRWPRWVLGVYAYNTEQGVVVTRVVPGSAAWRLRLEPGDRIVTVGGYQIGWVEDWLYPLSDELQRQADRRGEVTLLLQNVRNGQLLTRRVQLDGGRDRRPIVPQSPDNAPRDRVR